MYDFVCRGYPKAWRGLLWTRQRWIPKTAYPGTYGNLTSLQDIYNYSTACNKLHAG